MLKYSSQQLTRVEDQFEPEVAHFEHTKSGLGIAHLVTEPILFALKTPVTQIQLSVSLNFNFRFVRAGSDEADYLLHDLSLRCEPLETEYDDYMTYYQNMEYQNELPSFQDFFKNAHYNSDLVFAGYPSKAALGYSPLPTQSKRCGKQLFQCHAFYFVPTISQNANRRFGVAAKSQKLLRLAACGEERAKGCRPT